MKSPLHSKLFVRVAWSLFALEVAIVLSWAGALVIANPPQTASAEVTGPERSQFGLPEAKRQELFRDLVKGEPADRATAERESETAIWDRNHDSFYHQREWPRIVQTAHKHHIPTWEMAAILDEGLRAHWPPPPGVELRCDDAPLRSTTRPLSQRPLITGAP